jgi:hypothetical protein
MLKTSDPVPGVENIRLVKYKRPADATNSEIARLKGACFSQPGIFNLRQRSLHDGYTA